MIETSQNPVPIASHSKEDGNIFWSVMIPTYQPMEKYLRKTIESVLEQDFNPKEIQIEVVDDCSAGVDVAALVKSISDERVHFSQTPKNLGLAGCWNTCIERSLGRWVHILHQDDYVLPGFYQTLAKMAKDHPKVSLVATRSFYVDGDCVITGITRRLMKLENGGRAVDDFFYSAPIECAGVVVRRSFYEKYGGFRSDLPLTLDCEMWTRVISLAGGLVTSDVLSCFRKYGGNESDRLARTTEGLYDIERLHQIFVERYPHFDCKKARLEVCKEALGLYERYYKNGEFEAAKANLDYWEKNAPISLRLQWFARKIARRIFK